jgi:Tfp pilus assembly protein PilZ
MISRRSARRPRRLQVTFWQRGGSQGSPGHTENISMSGMFLGTNSPLPQGSRLRIEIHDREHGFVVEGEVVHARKVHGELGRIKPSGMGIRFLSVEELIRELLPSVAPELEPIPGSSADPEEPPAEISRLAPTAPVESVWSVRFPSPGQFLEIYHRDLANGGLFVSTSRPARLQESVVIDLYPPEEGGEPIRLRARVAQRFEPQPVEGAPGRNLLAGMWVELLDPREVQARLRPWVERLG